MSGEIDFQMQIENRAAITQLISMSETDLWDRQQNISHYRFSFEFHLPCLTNLFPADLNYFGINYGMSISDLNYFGINYGMSISDCNCLGKNYGCPFPTFRNSQKGALVCSEKNPKFVMVA